MTDPGHPAVPWREAVRAWVTVAIHSFGGPAAQIATLHRVVVEERRWLSEERFLGALSYCTLLPGPEAQQLATYIGWRLHGVRGGLVAGSLFVLPGFIAILLLSLVYVTQRDAFVVAGILAGITPAVIAIVLQAMIRLGRRSSSSAHAPVLAAAAFVALYAFHVPFPAVVVAAGLVGAVIGSRRPAPAPNETDASNEPRPGTARTLRTLAIWLAIWLVPLAVLAVALGRHHVLVQEGTFFSKVAVITFGGAYAVLPYVADQAVSAFGWVTPNEMLDGLGMAESTPGPLIQVVQFVGFLGAFRGAPGTDPLLAGVAGSVVTTWATFVPSFLYIFVGAPYVEWLLHNRALAAALRGITAAAVGVIANLAVWFTIHTLFGEVRVLELGAVRFDVPELASVRWNSLLIAASAVVATFVFRVALLPLLGGAAVVGLVLRAFSVS